MKIKKKLSHIIVITTALIVTLITSTSFAAAKTVTYSNIIESRLFPTYTLENYLKPDTPSFNVPKYSASFLTSQERIDYLTKLCSQSQNMYLFFDETCADTPIVFFTLTDLSKVNNFSDAAKILSENGKLNVFYQAQVHGNEPAAGEGALYFLSRLQKDILYSKNLAANINLCIVPCANPEAADLQVRQLANGYNLNRDNLFVGSKQTLLLHQIYENLNPDVVIDGHECLPNHQGVQDESQNYFTDIFIAGTTSLNIDPAINQWSSLITDQAISDCNNAGLRASLYDNDSTDINNTVSRTYYGLRGSVSILIESTGINMAKSHFERRVYSHYKAVTSILDTVIENKEAIKSEVKSVRDSVAQNGKKYNVDNRTILKHGISGENYKIILNDLYNAYAGSFISTIEYTVYKHDQAIRSRALPTAFIISKKNKNADLVVEKLSYSGIEYLELEPGTRISVGSYKGDGTKASVTAKRTLNFYKGAYLIPMDQPGAKVIAACLEPDIAETLDSDGTFVQAGLLKAEEIYRYTKTNPGKTLSAYVVK